MFIPFDRNEFNSKFDKESKALGLFGFKEEIDALFDDYLERTEDAILQRRAQEIIQKAFSKDGQLQIPAGFFTDSIVGRFLLTLASGNIEQYFTSAEVRSGVVSDRTKGGIAKQTFSTNDSSIIDHAFAIGKQFMYAREAVARYHEIRNK